MTDLESGNDWTPLVHQAVDDLLDALAEHGPEGWVETPPEGGRQLFRWAPEDDEVDADRPELRRLLTAYTMQVVATASTGAGSLRCNDGKSTVDCQFVLRPNGTPYYRCMHSPPDCYDPSFQKIGCP